MAKSKIYRITEQPQEKETWSYKKYHAILGSDTKKLMANLFSGFFTFDLCDVLILIPEVYCCIVLVQLTLEHLFGTNNIIIALDNILDILLYSS